MLTNPVETLKKYVDQPSGSHDQADVYAVAALIQEDFESLGFNVVQHKGPVCGPTLECTIGTGEKNLMLLGHMDTVFPHDVFVPFKDNGDGTATGSGSYDMKGGIMIMLYALKEALPGIDLSKYSIRAIINPDEEIGSFESEKIILNSAAKSIGVLSFEPCAGGNRLAVARKGVTNVTISCKGIPGHAGAQYKQCASAIQALCMHINNLYALRDDEEEISFNAGVITGGTAENVVAPSASCRCEFRYFKQPYQKMLMEKITAICAQEVVPGVTTTVEFGASHPAIDLTPESQVLLDYAVAIGREQGRELIAERTGGASDIAIAGQAGVGVLDGFGMAGGGAHTAQEYVLLDAIPQQIELASKMISRICAD